MQELEKLQKELEKARTELDILYEISNAMRTTLKLEEILYIILTGVTCHMGLGFNRAMLFLLNERENVLEGKIGIGPDTGEEAERIWKGIEAKRMDLDDLISGYRNFKSSESKLNSLVKSLKIPLERAEESVLVLTFLEGMPLHITKETVSKFSQDPLISALNTTEFITVPLKAKDRAIGVILADNVYTKEPITKDDIRLLTMFANQAGMAIENAYLYEKTVILSQTDSLTKLWNHGYFHYKLSELLEKAKEENLHLSLIILDLDNFKIYNDRLGHQTGDEILIKVSEIIRESSRKDDFACRYGGEEFVIILPRTKREEAYIIAERIREKIERFPFKYENILPGERLTVSLGIASFPENGISKQDLITYADKKLYEAKSGGKNRTCY
jgi:diguanylate cyclase (GGDEF)-like protein